MNSLRSASIFVAAPTLSVAPSAGAQAGSGNSVPVTQRAPAVDPSAARTLAAPGGGQILPVVKTVTHDHSPDSRQQDWLDKFTRAFQGSLTRSMFGKLFKYTTWFRMLLDRLVATGVLALFGSVIVQPSILATLLMKMFEVVLAYLTFASPEFGGAVFFFVASWAVFMGSGLFLSSIWHHGCFAGGTEWIVMRCIGVDGILQNMPLYLKLWPPSIASFRFIFLQVVQRCGLEEYGFTWGGLRAGACTHMIVRDEDMSRIQFLGRWRSHASMSSYVQEAASSLVWIQISPHTKAIMRSTLAVALQLASSMPLLP